MYIAALLDARWLACGRLSRSPRRGENCFADNGWETLAEESYLPPEKKNGGCKIQKKQNGSHENCP